MSSVTVIEQVNQLTVSGDDPPTLTVTQVVPSITVSATGPQGVPGPQGPQGPAGDASGLGFVHTQSTPATLVQIVHNMPKYPGGIVCLEADGTSSPLGVTVSYPSIGIVELGFGVPFTGQIYLS